MKGYLSIGAVSKRKNVSIKSLRYYDRIGVFRPAYINKATNYRYYTEDQLFLLDAITLCIDLGIPLKDFDRYIDAQGNFNLQKLMYDGKTLAEQRIIEIRSKLSTLQSALQAFDHKPVPILPKESILSSVSFYRKNLPTRHVLTLPLPETKEQEAANDTQKMILRLFMLAQLQGMTAEYPSGLLYDYAKDGTCKRSIFVTVKGFEQCTDNRLRAIPAGTYQCTQGNSHPVLSINELTKELPLAGKEFTVIESDLLDNSAEDEHNSLELQIYSPYQAKKF